ncbi:hypothetical protein Pelo_6152 [Pelomyxa schiedti]|nr:hypothetical protein Pelo_6152 [Pelomyxa schiedti]
MTAEVTVPVPLRWHTTLRAIRYRQCMPGPGNMLLHHILSAFPHLVTLVVGFLAENRMSGGISHPNPALKAHQGRSVLQVRPYSGDTESENLRNTEQSYTPFSWAVSVRACSALVAHSGAAGIYASCTSRC